MPSRFTKFQKNPLLYWWDSLSYQVVYLYLQVFSQWPANIYKYTIWCVFFNFLYIVILEISFISYNVITIKHD